MMRSCLAAVLAMCAISELAAAAEERSAEVPVAEAAAAYDAYDVDASRQSRYAPGGYDGPRVMGPRLSPYALVYGNFLPAAHYRSGIAKRAMIQIPVQNVQDPYEKRMYVARIGKRQVYRARIG